MALRFLALAFILLVSTFARANAVCGPIQLHLANVDTTLILSQQGPFDLAKEWTPLIDGTNLKLTEMTSVKAVVLDEYSFNQYGTNYAVKQIAVKFHLASDEAISLAWDQEKLTYAPVKSFDAYVVCTESQPQ